MAVYNPKTKIWSGPCTHSVLNPAANIGQVIVNLLERTPNKVSQLNDLTNESLTCNELRLRAIRVAMSLTNMGYGVGDIVALIAKNSTDIIPSLVGCFISGVTVNPLDPKLAFDDIVRMFKLTKPSAVFCDGTMLDRVRLATRQADITCRFFLVEAIAQVAKADDTFEVQHLLKGTGDENFYVPPYWGDSAALTALIMCSSGTTGIPKAVQVSHAQLIQINSHASALDENEVILCFSNFYWISGIQLLLMGIFNGIKRIITPLDYSPALATKIIREHGVTIFFAPSAHASELVHSNAMQEDLRTVKYFASGGSMVPDSLAESINRLLTNGRCVTSYGLSEVGGGICANVYPRSGSVGSLLPMVKAKIVDDSGYIVGPTEVGEILLQGLFPFLGYYNDKEATRYALDEDGFLRTGDIGYFDLNGFLYILDRKKEILKYANYQISPSELEAALTRINGVMLVAVVGVHEEDKSFDDLPTALVVRDKTFPATLREKDLQEAIDHELQVDYKKLRGGVFFVDHLPMTMSGKLDRAAIKVLANELYRKRLEPDK